MRLALMVVVQSALAPCMRGTSSSAAPLTTILRRGTRCYGLVDWRAAEAGIMVRLLYTTSPIGANSLGVIYAVLNLAGWRKASQNRNRALGAMKIGY